MVYASIRPFVRLSAAIVLVRSSALNAARAVARLSARRRDTKQKSDAVAERIHAAGERARKEAEGGERLRAPARPKEIGGPASPEPTRYGDWERKGLASDF
jgi:hypothetical protein